MAADTADDGDPPARAAHVGQRRLDRAQHAEDVRLELPAIVLERKAIDAPDDAEAGVGHDDGQAAKGLTRTAHGALDLLVDGHVARSHDDTRPAGGQLGGQRVQPLDTAGRERHGGALPGEAPSQRGPDARRGASDEDDFVSEGFHGA